MWRREGSVFLEENVWENPGFPKRKSADFPCTKLQFCAPYSLCTSTSAECALVHWPKREVPTSRVSTLGLPFASMF